jgi:HSP20 family protein
MSRERSDAGSNAPGDTSTAASTRTSNRETSATRDANASQTQPLRASGANIADRNAESTILPALMSNPWLMTNAFLANPFGLARVMNQEMDRLFSGRPDDVSLSAQRAGPGSQDSGSLDVSRPQRGLRHWSPQVEVRQNGNQLTVCADLPGLSAKDIDIEVEDGILTISGERHQSSEDKKEGYYRSERSYGSFSRSIALPDGVDESQIRAKFDNGVLEVTVPVPEHRQRGRRVEIQSGG